MKILATAALLLTVALAHQALAATYYLATDGADSNPGTKDKPWATFAFASQRVQPGDTVKVLPGVYHQNAVIVNCRGTAEQPIVFEAAGGADGGKVTIDGSVPVTDWHSDGGSRYSATVKQPAVHLVWADGRLLMLGPNFSRESFAAVQPTDSRALKRGQAHLADGRLTVRLFDNSDPGRAAMRVSLGQCLLLRDTHYTIWRGIGAAYGLNGVKLERGSSHNTFADAEIHHAAQGILENGESGPIPACTANTFENLDVHHIGLTKFDHGIYTNGVDTRVLHCRFHHITGTGIHAYPAPLRGVYDGNTISEPLLTWHPKHFEGENPPDATGHYTGFVCWGRGEHQVTNNVIAGPFAIGINVRSENNRIINNTIVVTAGDGIRLADDSTGNRLLNNIIQANGSYIIGLQPAELDYNGYWGGRGWNCGSASYATLGELQKASLELHGLVAEPGFLDPASGNYRLAPGSPLRNAGLGSTAPAVDILGASRPLGKGVDLGAYEAE